MTKNILHSAAERSFVEDQAADEQLGVHRFNTLTEIGFTDKDAHAVLQTLHAIEDPHAQKSYWHGLVGDK